MARKREYSNLYPSTTQILSILDKPGLTAWFKNNTPQFIKAESKKAKEIGNQLHSAIQNHIELDTLKVDTQYPVEITNALKSFMLFKKEHPEIKLQRAEIQMTSESLQVNGTLDCLGNNGEAIIVDWKSGNAKDDIKPPIYDEYLLQVAAYTYLYNETQKANIKKAIVVSLAKDKIAYNIEILNEKILLCAWGIFIQCLGIYKDKKILTQLRKE